MEYNSDKSLHRQRICMKCKSFVTHDKVDDLRVSCPLCGHQIKTPKSRVEFLGLDAVRQILARRNDPNSSDDQQKPVEAESTEGQGEV